MTATAQLLFVILLFTLVVRIKATLTERQGRDVGFRTHFSDWVPPKPKPSVSSALNQSSQGEPA